MESHCLLMTLPSSSSSNNNNNECMICKVQNKWSADALNFKISLYWKQVDNHNSLQWQHTKQAATQDSTV